MKKLLSMLLVISMLASVLVMLPVSAATTVPQYFEDFEGKDSGGGVMVEDATEEKTSGYGWYPFYTSTSYTNGIWEVNSSMDGGKNTSAAIYANMAAKNNEIVTSRVFNISPDDFEKVGAKLEYGFDLYIPAYDGGYPMVVNWLTAGGLNADGTATTIQEISRGAYLRQYSSKLRFESAMGTAESSNKYEGQSGNGDTNAYRRLVTDFGTDSNEWAKIKTVVSYNEDTDGTKYYLTENYINDKKMTDADGNAVQYRINERSIAPWGGAVYSSSGLNTDGRCRNSLAMHIRIKNSSNWTEDKKATLSGAIDNMYIKLYEPPKYEQNFEGVSKDDIMAESGTNNMYKVEDNVLKIPGITSTVEADIPKTNIFNILSDDFEDADKYLEMGYKIKVPKTLGNGGQIYGLLTLWNGNNRVEEIARTPWIMADANNIKVYSISGSTEKNAWAARNYGNAKQILSSRIAKSSIKGDYVEYDVKSIVKYVVEDGVGYYVTANIIDGKLLVNDEGTPAIHKVEAMDGVMARSSMTMHILAKGDGTSVMELDDLYIRLVDEGAVNRSDITVDPATRKATIAYLNTTGSTQTSEKVMIAAYNDANVLLGVKIETPQTFNVGEGTIGASFENEITGATNYKAFYWNDNMQPLLPAVGANIPA